VFVTKVAKPQTKTAECSTSKPVHHGSTHGEDRLAHDPVEQVLFPQPTRGNQTKLRFLARPTSSSDGSASASGHEQEAATKAKEASSSVCWNFRKIPLFPTQQADRAQPLSVHSAQPRVVQPRLQIGPADGPLEREADDIAGRVMRMRDPALSISKAQEQINRKCASCEEDDRVSRSRAVGAAERTGTKAPDLVRAVLASPGRPIDRATRAFFEPRFRYDFSRVRLHDDAEAAESARAIDALAYAAGEHVVFAAGAGRPDAQRDKTLIAHELAHVVQQSADGQAKIMRQHSPRQPQGPGAKNLVRSIDPITAAGVNAVSGFPAMPVSDCNLNAPGPVNNTTTGACRNINQVRFGLAGIDSKDVRLLRIVERTTVAGGKTKTIEKSDGPSDPTVLRPNASEIAVGDCPGFGPDGANAMPATAFPVSYHAHFILSAHDAALGMAALGKLSYDVKLEKKAVNDPIPVNTFTVTDKQIF